MPNCIFLRFWCLLALFAALAASARAQTVEFNRDIRPVLSDKCFACHGPDKNHRKADLRLDTELGLRGNATEPGAVVPAKPQDSELYRRITSDDATERMPPPKHGKDLTAKEIDLFKRWIEQGAAWQGHWSLQPNRRPVVPNVPGAPKNANPIDGFILQTLREQKLPPS